MTSFADMLAAGYGFTDPAVTLGAALEGGAVHPEPKVRVPLAMMNRHGLMAGATGTGKTQHAPAAHRAALGAGRPGLRGRHQGRPERPRDAGRGERPGHGSVGGAGVRLEAGGVPVEFVSLTGALGVQLRATVSSFGPLLLGKALSLNETQTSVLTLVFKYADDSGLPLLDLSDLRAVLQFLVSDEGKAGAGAATAACPRRRWACCCGRWSSWRPRARSSSSASRSSTSTTCCRTTSDGRGVVTCLELADAQDKPALFSTFMMWLLAELYHNLPEAGDLPKPKLVFFFDEAHLLFDEASKAFLDQIQQVVRLIRSKGVGVYMVTQTPKDVPDEVLAQLGNRVQHALRAHTPNDDKALKATVRTFPKTDVLRPGGDAHLPGHRRGGGDRARPAGHPDAGGCHPSDPAAPRGWRR